MHGGKPLYVAPFELLIARTRRSDRGPARESQKNARR